MKICRIRQWQKKYVPHAIYPFWNLDNHCPRCGRKLRLKPKNARLKVQYHKILKNKQQLARQINQQLITSILSDQ